MGSERYSRVLNGWPLIAPFDHIQILSECGSVGTTLATPLFVGGEL